MSVYAKRTTVAVDKSRWEIEATIRRYRADQFGTAVDVESHRAMVQFRVKKWIVRFELPLPAREKFSSQNGFEQAERQRWRALCLSIKAKLETVESGITTFESEFLSHIVLPDGKTIGQHVITQLPQIAEGRDPMTLLPNFADHRGGNA